MAAANSITVTVLEIIKSAMREIGALAGGEEPSNDDREDVLRKFQRVIDTFNAKRTMIYNVDFARFTIPTNTQPIGIGPGQAFDVNQRPVEIVSATLILSGTNPEVEIVLNVRDQQWWAGQVTKALTSTLPTDLYYDPAWANGGVYLWPIPTAVNDIRLEMRGVLAQVTAYDSAFSLPPGYWDAIVYTLACSLGPMFEKPITPDLERLRQYAINAIVSNNVASPRGRTADAGMPGSGCKGDFNYRIGGPNS